MTWLAEFGRVIHEAAHIGAGGSDRQASRGPDLDDVEGAVE
jgi:hypothetical protein